MIAVKSQNDSVSVLPNDYGTSTVHMNNKVVAPVLDFFGPAFRPFLRLPPFEPLPRLDFLPPLFSATIIATKGYSTMKSVTGEKDLPIKKAPEKRNHV